MDYETLTDAELQQVVIDAATEQNRRLSLAAIPAQIAQLATIYTTAGGDQADLTAAITPPPATTP